MSKIDDMLRDGLAHHQAGRRDAARALYLKVLARQPSHAAANHLLGLLFLQQGEADEAVKHLQRAVRGHRSAEYLGNLGTALNAAGRAAEAVDAFDAALALQPKSPGILNNRGMALKALGRHDDAIESYRRAIALAPGDAMLQRNLGNALAAVGYLNEAIAAYRAALRLRPDFGNAAIGLGNALTTLGRAHEAMAETAVLAEQLPSNAEIQRAAAQAAKSAGDLVAAARGYRRAIAANPHDAEAHRLLGLVVARTDPHDPEIAAIRRLLELPDLPFRDRVQLGFALAQACEDLGQGDEAFDWFSRANGWLSEKTPHDPHAESLRHARIMERYAALPDSALPPLAAPTGPVFVVGLPRSGKSTLEAMLARHSDLVAAGELGVLRNLYSMSSAPDADIGNAGVAPATRRAIADRWRSMVEQAFGAHRVIDTTPGNLEFVGVIRQCLPDARVIFCHREPIGHAAALFTKYFAEGGHQATFSIHGAARSVAAARELGRFWARRFRDYVTEVDTSMLGLDPGALDTAADFVGLQSQVRTPEAPQTEPRLNGANERGQQGRARLLAELRQLEASASTDPSRSVHRG